MRDKVGDRTQLAPTALLVILVLGIGSLLPVLRDALVAARLGATDDSDAYFLSTYIILMVVTILVAESTVPATVVTLSTPSKCQAPAGHSLIRSLLFAGGILLGVALLVAALAVPIVMLFAPGFDSTTVETTAKATAVVAPAILFIGAARLVGAFLNSAGYFMLPALLTPVIAIGAIIPLLAGTTSPIVAAAGWTIGSMAGLALLFGWAFLIYKTGRERHPVTIQLNRDRIVQLLRLSVPLVILVTVRQGPEIVDRVISSGLSSGSLTSVVLAKKTMVLPSTILIAAVGAVVLPYLSRQEPNSNRSDAFAHSINLALFFLLPVSLLLVVTRTDLVTLLYGRGEFTAANVSTTSTLLGIYALALVPLTLGIILQNSFAALDESKTPVLPYTISLGGLIVIAWAATRVIGISGLPIAFLIAEGTYTIVLLVLLHRRVAFRSRSLGWPAAIAMFGTALSGVALLPLVLVHMEPPLLAFVLAATVASLVYAATMIWLKHPAAEDILDLIFHRSSEETDAQDRVRVAIESTYAMNQTGTGRYISSLIENLNALGVVEVISFRAPRVEILPRIVRLPVNGVLHAFWCQIIFPIAAWRRKVDLIHTTMIAPIVAPCDVVMTVHDGLDFQPHWRPSAAWSAYVRTVGVWAARRATAIITGSEAAAAEVCETFKIPADRITIVWHGSDLIGMERKRPAGVMEMTQSFLLMVGSANQRKNVETAVEAARIVRNRFNIDLVVVGQVPGSAYTDDDWLLRLNSIEDSELAWLYAHATAVIVPSRHEGFGYPVLEALTFDCPVVASDIPALREVGGQAARFADPEQPDQFARHIFTILEDPARERTRIAFASDKARSITSLWMAQQTQEVYLRVTGTQHERAVWSSIAAS